MAKNTKTEPDWNSLFRSVECSPSRLAASALTAVGQLVL